MKSINVNTRKTTVIGKGKRLVHDVAEIIVGPNGVGIRHRAFNRSNQFERDENPADVKWRHHSGPGEVTLIGEIVGAHHIDTASGIAAVYLIGGKDVVLDFRQGDSIKLYVGNAASKFVVESGPFVMRLANPSGIIDFPSDADLNATIAKATGLLSSVPRPAVIQVWAHSPSMSCLVGPLWQEERE